MRMSFLAELKRRNVIRVALGFVPALAAVSGELGMPKQGNVR